MAQAVVAAVAAAVTAAEEADVDVDVGVGVVHLLHPALTLILGLVMAGLFRPKEIVVDLREVLGLPVDGGKVGGGRAGMTG